MFHLTCPKDLDIKMVIFIAAKRSIRFGHLSLTGHQFWHVVGVDSLSVLFNHRSFQKPIAIFSGFLEVF